MILSAITAGAGLLGGIFGKSKAAKAAREQKRLLESARKDEKAWYERNYYQDYIDSSAGRAAMKRVEDTLRKRDQTARATAAVTGGTPEAVIAQQENDQELMSDTVGNLAAMDTQRKAQIDSQHQSNLNALNNQQLQQLQMDEQGAGMMAGNSLSLIGTALSGIDFKKKGGA